MKKFFSQQISLKISLLIFVFAETLWIVYFLLQRKSPDWLYMVLSGLIFSVIMYFIVKLSVENYIYRKIRVLYKTIHNLKTTNKKGQYDDQWLENAEKDILKWVEEKKTELENLKKSDSYRRDFLGNVAHELKTPIFNIQGYVLTLLDGGLEDPTINREYLLRAEKSIDRMIAIINDLDIIAKLESETQKLEFEKFDLVALSNEVIDAYEIKASEKSIKLYISNKLAGSIHVFADKERIRQVLNNLIENSIKYGKTGGRTKITFYDMDEQILTEVGDDGMGIPQDEIPRIFERFYRTSAARNKEPQGSGLGLAIVKHIIEAHKQTIHVRSTLGVGTTFGFTLKKAR